MSDYADYTTNESVKSFDVRSRFRTKTFKEAQQRTQQTQFSQRNNLRATTELNSPESSQYVGLLDEKDQVRIPGQTLK